MLVIPRRLSQIAFGMTLLALTTTGDHTTAREAPSAAGRPTVSRDEQRQQVIEAMKAAFGDKKRQVVHAMRVLDCAERLLKVSDLNADPFTVAVAAILHDIGRSKAGTTDHERDGAIVSRGILRKLEFSESFTQHISRIVGSHHSALSIDTPEFRIVWIADRLVNQKRDHREADKLKQEYLQEAQVLSRKIQANKAAAHAERASLPPIECPLRRAGIDPQNLKPFDEVEQYITFLERPDRTRWQKPDEVVEALALKGNEMVIDLGAGSGYFTFRLAEALPSGRVVAIDSQPEMARHIHRKVLTEGIPNIQARVAESDADPGLPAGADVVFVCDVLMHVKQRTEWLKTIHDQMQRGSKLVLIDFKQGDLPEGPPEEIKVPKSAIVQLCTQAGFALKEDRSELLPYQEFLVFQRR